MSVFEARMMEVYGHERRYLLVRLWRFAWDALDWSLSYNVERNRWLSLFSLRCMSCRKWYLGCKDHWFCGLCEPCRAEIEADKP